METHEMLSSACGSVLRVLENTLEGLTVEDVNWQHKPDCISIGWH